MSFSTPPPFKPRQGSRTRLLASPGSEGQDGDGDLRTGDQSSGGKSRFFGRGMGMGDWDERDWKRIRTLGMAVMVGLASGSNYAYSAYAPQLATQLVISSTVVNLVGLAGNLGMYATGPIWGKLVDAKGQQTPLLLGGLLTFSGYSLVRAFFTHFFSLRSNADPSSTPTAPRVALLAFSMFLTGCGGTAGLTSALNAIAKSFPDKTRGSAAGLVLAGFGLSAFTFSTLGHLIWKGDAGGLLFLLAIGTSLPMLIASFLLRPVPPEENQRAVYEPLLQDEEVLIEEGDGIVGSAEDMTRGTSNSLELTRSRSPISRGRHEHQNHNHHDHDLHAHFGTLPTHESIHNHTYSHGETLKPSHSRSSSLASIPPTALSHSPLYLVYSLDFWILFTILALLCGTGLMYINNAGTVALALAREGQANYDKEAVSGWQAKQVGLVSIWNCSGRVLGGLYSDFAKTRFRIARVWFLPIVCVLFSISQLAALSTTHVQSLWAVSCLLGLAYGSLFNALPMLVLEWFGMKHFSQNYGWITVAPIIGGNLFNLVFGRVYDAHTVGRVGTPEVLVRAVNSLLKRGGIPPADDGQHDCLLGEDCYGTAFKLSCAASVLALGLSVWAGLRRERASRERRKAILAGRVASSDEV